jgi:hypothetical protein
MKMIIILSSLFVGQAFAQSNISLIKKLEAIELEGNGSECHVYKYETKGFVYKKVAADFVKGKVDQSFEFTWNGNVSNLKFYATPEWLKTFKTLMNKKAVKAMFGSGPNPDICTESESCQLYDLEVYFNEGLKLSCNFDFTT